MLPERYFSTDNLQDRSPEKPKPPVATLLQSPDYNLRVLGVVALLTQEEERQHEDEFKRRSIYSIEETASVADNVREGTHSLLRRGYIVNTKVTRELELERYPITQELERDALKLLESCPYGNDPRLESIGGVREEKLQYWQNEYVRSKLTHTESILDKPLTSAQLSEIQNDLRAIPQYLLIADNRQEVYDSLYAKFAAKVLPGFGDRAVATVKRLNAIQPFNPDMDRENFAFAFEQAFTLILGNPDVVRANQEIFPAFHSIMRNVVATLEGKSILHTADTKQATKSIIDIFSKIEEHEKPPTQDIPGYLQTSKTKIEKLFLLNEFKYLGSLLRRKQKGL